MTNTIFGNQDLDINRSYFFITELDYSREVSCSIYSSDLVYWLELKVKNTTIRIANIYVGRTSEVASDKCLELYTNTVETIIQTRDIKILEDFIKPIHFEISILVFMQYLEEASQIGEQEGKSEAIVKVRSLLGL